MLLTFAKAFFAFLRQERRLEVEELAPARLLLRCGATETVFDNNYKIVVRRGNVVERFDAIRCVELQYVHGDESPSYWEVRLGRFPNASLSVGSSSDDVEASVAAARISSMLGKPVQYIT